MFLQLDNYKALQFSEQEINDTKIRSYLKTVVGSAPRDPLLESVWNSVKVVPRREARRLPVSFSFRVKRVLMLWVNVLSKAGSTKTCLSCNTSAYFPPNKCS